MGHRKICPSFRQNPTQCGVFRLWTPKYFFRGCIILKLSKDFGSVFDKDSVQGHSLGMHLRSSQPQNVGVEKIFQCIYQTFWVEKKDAPTLPYFGYIIQKPIYQCTNGVMLYPMSTVNWQMSHLLGSKHTTNIVQKIYIFFHFFQVALFWSTWLYP